MNHQSSKNSPPSKQQPNQKQSTVRKTQHEQSQNPDQQQYSSNASSQEAHLRAEHQRELDIADHRTGNFREFDAEAARQAAAKQSSENS